MIEYDTSKYDLDKLIKKSPMDAILEGLEREWMGHNTLYTRVYYIINALNEELKKEKAKNGI